MWFISVEVEQETFAPPPKKKTWIRPRTGKSLTILQFQHPNRIFL